MPANGSQNFEMFQCVNSSTPKGTEHGQCGFFSLHGNRATLREPYSPSDLRRPDPDSDYLSDPEPGTLRDGMRLAIEFVS